MSRVTTPLNTIQNRQQQRERKSMESFHQVVNSKSSPKGPLLAPVMFLSILGATRYSINNITCDTA